MVPMRADQTVKAHHELEDTTVCSRRREEAGLVHIGFIRLLTVGTARCAVRAA